MFNQRYDSERQDTIQLWGDIAALVRPCTKRKWDRPRSGLRLTTEGVRAESLEGYNVAQYRFRSLGLAKTP
jgi:hypothetical protein